MQCSLQEGISTFSSIQHILDHQFKLYSVMALASWSNKSVNLQFWVVLGACSSSTARLIATVRIIAWQQLLRLNMAHELHQSNCSSSHTGGGQETLNIFKNLWSAAKNLQFFTFELWPLGNYILTAIQLLCMWWSFRWQDELKTITEQQQAFHFLWIVVKIIIFIKIYEYSNTDYTDPLFSGSLCSK